MPAKKKTPVSSNSEKKVTLKRRPIIKTDQSAVSQADLVVEEPQASTTVHGKTLQPVSLDLLSDVPVSETITPPIEPTAIPVMDTVAITAQEEVLPPTTSETQMAPSDSVTKKIPKSVTAAERAEEIEQLIINRTYAVPINAVQRKRSRIVIIFACAIGLVLALILIDFLLDSGVVSWGFPHSHFFAS